MDSVVDGRLSDCAPLTDAKPFPLTTKKEVNEMLNRVILMGRLTGEPDYRTTQSGAAMARFTLAIERDYSHNEEKQTDFLDIIAWRSTADFVSRYFHKGQLVAVQGRVQVNSYTDKDGNKRRSWDIVADQVYFAEPKRENSPQGRDSRQTPPETPQASYQLPPYPPYQGEQQMMDGYQSDSDFGAMDDDDLPF